MDASNNRATASEQERFPRRVRVWHFIALPALAMGAALLAARMVEPLVEAGSLSRGFYGAARTVMISVVMASVIGWLAVGYRRQYEERLKRRNLALEETRDFLRRIIDGCGEGIITLDTEDRITAWNPAAERIFGWTAEEMLGNTFERLLPPSEEIRAGRARVGNRLRAGETVRDFETTRIRKDGASIAIRATWTPLYDRGGQYSGTTAIVLDVSAESEMRRRLVEQERLAAVGEMAAQVAHEVRNPLAGLRGACQLIFNGRGDRKMQQEIGQEVLHQIDRLNGTVTELLEFAHPRSIVAEPTDLNALIEHVIGMLHEDPGCAGVKVVRRFHPELPAVRVDPRQLEQVFYNLFLNACQAMDSTGTITISTHRDGAQVRAVVADSGPGVPPEVAKKIFMPFFSTRAKGTGLGLAIVRKILVAHGGTIDVGGRNCAGAEFCVSLPLGSAETAVFGERERSAGS